MQTCYILCHQIGKTMDRAEIIIIGTLIGAIVYLIIEFFNNNNGNGGRPV